MSFTDARGSGAEAGGGFLLALAAALVAFMFASAGALPGAICGAIWWWAHRRHLQGIAA